MSPYIEKDGTTYLIIVILILFVLFDVLGLGNILEARIDDVALRRGIKLNIKSQIQRQEEKITYQATVDGRRNVLDKDMSELE